MHKQWVNKVLQLSLTFLFALLLFTGCEKPNSSATLFPPTVSSMPTVVVASPVSQNAIKDTSTPVVKTPTPTILPPTLTAASTSTLEPVKSLRLLKELDFPARRFALSPDRTWFAFSYSDTIEAIRLATGENVFTFVKPYASIQSPEPIQFSPDGAFLAAYASIDGIRRGVEGVVYVWTSSTWKLRYQFRVPYSPAVDLKFSTDSHYLAVVSANGLESVDAWDIQRGNYVTRLQIPCNEVAFLPAQPVMATAELLLPLQTGPTVRLWDLSLCKSSTCNAQAELFTFLDKEDQYNEASSLSFSEDSRLLAVIVNQKLHIWDLERQRELTWPTKVAIEKPERVVFSSRGVLAVLEHHNGLITLFAPDSGEKLGKVQLESQNPVPLPAYQYSMQFSQDGKILTTGGGNTSKVQFWEVP